ncbi:hypothetical protein CR513_10068, partial [Mucuna pruriens]
MESYTFDRKGLHKVPSQYSNGIDKLHYLLLHARPPKHPLEVLGATNMGLIPGTRSIENLISLFSDKLLTSSGNTFEKSLTIDTSLATTSLLTFKEDNIKYTWAFSFKIALAWLDVMNLSSLPTMGSPKTMDFLAQFYRTRLANNQSIPRITSN